MENLWPTFEKKEVQTPKSVFDKQVEYFNNLNNGIKAYLSSTLEGEYIRHTFRLQVSALNGYTITLFRASNKPVALYPTTLTNALTDYRYEIKNIEELIDTLKLIFNQEETVKTIENLLAQIEEEEGLPF